MSLDLRSAIAVALAREGAREVTEERIAEAHRGIVPAARGGLSIVRYVRGPEGPYGLTRGCRLCFESFTARYNGGITQRELDHVAEELSKITLLVEGYRSRWAASRLRTRSLRRKTHSSLPTAWDHVTQFDTLGE